MTAEQHDGQSDTGRHAARRSVSVDAEDALHRTHRVIRRKWHPLIMFHLLDGGPLRFRDFENRIDDITSKVLSDSLKHLDENGLVHRRVKNTSPLRVEYSLTERGEHLRPVVEAMLDWGSDRLEEQVTTRGVTDIEDCGERSDTWVNDSRT